LLARLSHQSGAFELDAVDRLRRRQVASAIFVVDAEDDKAARSIGAVPSDFLKEPAVIHPNGRGAPIGL